MICDIIYDTFCDIIYDIYFVPNCHIQHKSYIIIFRRWQSRFFHFTVHPVDAFSKFLHVVILVQKCGDFRIAGKVNLAYIAQTDDAR